MNTLFLRNGLKRALGLLLALVIMMSLTVPAFAATVRISNASLNSARTVITMYLSEIVTLSDGVDLKSKVLLSRNGEAADSLPYGSEVSLDGSKVTINLTSALVDAKNYIVIESGAFVGQTTNITSPNIDAKGPELTEVSIDKTRKIVTFKFDCDIAGFSGEEMIEDGAILLARNGTRFSEEIRSSAIDVDSTAGTVKVRLSNELTDNNSKFKILAGAVQNADNGNVNIEDIVTDAIEAAIQIPQIDEKEEIELSSDGTTVTIPFTCNIKFATEEVRKNPGNYIALSRQGGGYYPLNTSDKVTISGNKMTIVFRYELEGNNNRLRFDANTIASMGGDVATTMMYSPWISMGSLKYKAPTYSEISYNKANKQVSIKFDEDIFAVSRKSVENSVQISRNNGDFNTLSSYDTVEIVNGNTILVTLDQGLTGEYNRFRILGGAVENEDGNIQTSTQTTDYIDLNAESYEAFEYELNMSADMQTADIVFDRYIQSVYPYDNDFDYLKQSISVMRPSTGNAYNNLTDYDSVTISGRTLRIVFQRALSENDVIKIDKYSLKDAYGAIMNSDIKIGPSLGKQEKVFDPNTGVELSADKKTVTFNFTQRVYNNMASSASLKYMLRVAYDGENFEELGEDCEVEFISYGTLSITFDRALSNPEARVKILAGALQNQNGDTISEDIVTNPLGQTDSTCEIRLGGERAYLGSEDSSTDIYGNRIYAITLNTTKTANALATHTGKRTFEIKLPEYGYGGKVKLNGTIVEQLINKDYTVTVSCGGVTNVFKASDLALSEALGNLGDASTIAQSVVLEIGVSRVETPYTTDFANKAKQKTFSIITQPTELTLVYTMGTKQYAVTKYQDYTEKRFKIKPSDAQNANITVVRIETSGKVNPVPTKIKTDAGDYYLDAMVKNSGVYGVISAERYFSDTPSWAQNAVNTLASRMILQNANAGPLRASDPVTRAEVAEMVTRALGLLTDKSGASKFLDVTLTDWYFPSTSIANENDLIRGYDDSTFRPERNITRQEVMAIMSRVMTYLGEDSFKDMTKAEAEKILASFGDASTVADWAKIDMAKCAQAKVVKGDNKGRLNPHANLTRAEMAQLIYNLMVQYDLI